eukprot:gene19847-20341_t
MRGDAQVLSNDVDKQGIALGRPHCGHVTDRPDGDSDQPQP